MSCWHLLRFPPLWRTAARPLCGLLLCLVLCLTARMVQALELRLAYSDVSTYPWQTGEGLQMSNPPGLAIELIRAAAQDLGVEVVFERLPNKRVLLALQNGSIDGAFIYSHNAERAAFASFPMKNGQPDSQRRVARLSYYIYQLKNTAPLWDGQQFVAQNRPIGANAGYSVVGDLKKMGIEVEEAKNTEQNFNKLRLGRLAAVAAQDVMTDAWLQKVKASDIEKLPQPLVSKDYFLIFGQRYAKEHAALVEKLWDRIAATREQRTRDALPHYPAP